jgi:heat shock protein HslJ
MNPLGFRFQEPPLPEEADMRPHPPRSAAAPHGIVLATILLAGCAEKAPPAEVVPAGPPPTPTIEQLRAASVTGVFEQPVTLAGGTYEGPAAEAGVASRPALRLWEPTFRTGDLDGTAGNEAVAMLAATTGGSGEFVHLAVFAVRDGALVNLGTAPVGDRTRLQSLWLERGKVIMDVIEVGADDAACCPTQVARKVYGIEGGMLKQQSSEVRGVLALSMLSANEWQLVEIDGEPLAAGIEAPLVHFESSTVRGFSGCNRFTAPVKESKPGEIAIGPAAGTKMACPPPQMEIEQKFLERLEAVNGYSYVAGQLALDWRKGDRQGRLLLRK